MSTTKISSKYQVVIPSEARKSLGLKAGDDLIVIVRDGHLVLIPKPKSFADATKGIMKGRYPEDYLQKERDSWD